MRCRVYPLRRRGRRLPWREVVNGLSFEGDLSTYHLSLPDARYFVAKLDEPILTSIGNGLLVLRGFEREGGAATVRCAELGVLLAKLHRVREKVRAGFSDRLLDPARSRKRPRSLALYLQRRRHRPIVVIRSPDGRSYSSASSSCSPAITFIIRDAEGSVMNTLRSVSRLFVSSSLALCASLAIAQVSTDLIVESVSDYGPGDQLVNSIPNGDGFAQGMLFPGSRFTAGARYTNTAVYDTDFVDPGADQRGNDTTFFDRRSRAIAYFTGHGITASRMLHGFVLHKRDVYKSGHGARRRNCAVAGSVSIQPFRCAAVLLHGRSSGSYT